MTGFGTLLSSLDVDPWTRQKDHMAALGIKADSFPGRTVNGSAVMTSQQVYGCGVYLYAGEVVTNVVTCVTVAGAGTAPTALKLGLWSSAATPACLSVTADLASDARWTSTGWKECALSSPYTVLSSDVYYPCFWINGAFGTTNMQLALGAGSGTFGGPIGSYKRHYGAVKTGATTMAVSDTGTYALAGNIPHLRVN